MQSGRAIYLAVLNTASLHPSRLEYWLRHIATFATARPPTLIVGTHRDQLTDAAAEKMRKSLEDYRTRPAIGVNIRSVHLVSCARHGHDLDELRVAILAEAQRLLGAQTLRVPATYLLLRELVLELKASQRPYVRFEDLERRASMRCSPAPTVNSATQDDRRLMLQELRTALTFFSDW